MGNGESRKPINLQNLTIHGQIYGCNAIYRDFSPHILFSVDKGITEEIVNSNYNGIHYTRHHYLQTISIPRKYNGHSSGTAALGLASYCATHIYMLGFDFGDQKPTFNNIYSSTPCYKHKDAKPTISKNWKNQIKKIVFEHPEIVYTRVVDSSLSSTFETDLPNLNTVSVLEFKQYFSC